MKRILSILLVITSLLSLFTVTSIGAAAEERDTRALKHGCACKQFTDLNPSAWYHDGVDYVLNNLLMNGVGNNKFNPNSSLSRAMLVTVLYRAAGSPKVSYSSTGFTDVPRGTWYTDAVVWANQSQIVNGVSQNKFAPENNISREQIATILYRYEGSPDCGNGIMHYSDYKQVSSYAYSAFCWADEQGIINGNNGRLLPKDKATRAQCAKMLYCYLTLKKPLQDPSFCEHSWETVASQKLTCTQDEYYRYYCAKCNSSVDDRTVATGHDFVVESGAAATCTQAGNRKMTCKKCWYSYTENVPALGHTTMNSSGVCTRCWAFVATYMFAKDGRVSRVASNQVAANQAVGWYTINDYVSMIKNKKVSADACEVSLEALEAYMSESNRSENDNLLSSDFVQITNAWRNAINCPIAILHNNVDTYYGYKRATISFRNLTEKTISRFDMVFYCHDAYGNPVRYYGSGSNSFNAYYDENYFYPYEIERIEWMLFGFDSCNKINNLKITKVAFADGTKWTR